MRMKTILSLSIHKGCFPKSRTNTGETPDDQVLRAILWNGRVAKHSASILWVAEYSHQNVFELLRALKLSAKEWSAFHGKCFVEGIDSDACCWPIESLDTSLSDQELEYSTRNHVVHCGGYKGLLCAVKPSKGVLTAKLYDVLPFPPADEVKGTIINCSFWSPNVFSVAEELRVMAKASARRQGIPAVLGLDDKEACWPEGFGLKRFG